MPLRAPNVYYKNYLRELDGVSFMFFLVSSSEGDGTLLQNSYKASQDL